MPSVIEVPDELATILRENASAQGKDLNSYAVAALSKAAQQDAMEADRQRQTAWWNSLTPQEQEAERDALREVQEELASGKPKNYKPLDQVIAEPREKHAFPEDWGTGNAAPLTDEEWAEIDAAFEARP